MAEIAKLSGQEYVNIYAKQAKDRKEPGAPDTDLSMLSIAGLPSGPALARSRRKRLADG